MFKDEQSSGYKPDDAAQNPDPRIGVFLLVSGVFYRILNNMQIFKVIIDG